MKLVVFGLGFSAKAFVDFASDRFSDITATVTSQEKATRTRMAIAWSAREESGSYFSPCRNLRSRPQSDP